MDKIAQKSPFVMPDWMEPYREMFYSTGGNSVEIYTEEQAAALMQIKPSQLAALRRRHNFEHINFGSFIRYNREQITAICETLTIGDKQKSISMMPKTMLRAA